MRTIVYIDAFNLYYRALRGKGAGFRWLDVHALAQRISPKGSTIERVKYFTARVKPAAFKPSRAQRQDLYLRALGTLPTVDVIEGRYVSREKWAYTTATPSQRVCIWHHEEKGSDVNLATHLMLDACRNAFDQAVVVTNDSDLTMPIAMVRHELAKRVVVANPASQKHSKDLRFAASEHRVIKAKAIRASQFANPLALADGSHLSAPTGW